jgi:flagellar motor switch protein FliN/FliY
MNMTQTSRQDSAATGGDNEIASAQVVSLREPAGGEATGPKLLDGNLALISGVKVKVEVLVGDAELTVAELFALQKGSVVPLQQLHHAPLTVRLDGKSIATGKLVVVGDNFGISITDVAASAPVSAA